MSINLLIRTEKDGDTSFHVKNQHHGTHKPIYVNLYWYGSTPDIRLNMADKTRELEKTVGLLPTALVEKGYAHALKIAAKPEMCPFIYKIDVN